MADSQFILELMFLQIRGGCSLTVLFFFLMLVGTCCFILSASLCVVRPTFRSLSDVHTLMSVGRKKCFQYVHIMLPLLRAVVKFCTANRLFKKAFQSIDTEIMKKPRLIQH